MRTPLACLLLAAAAPAFADATAPAPAAAHSPKVFRADTEVVVPEERSRCSAGDGLEALAASGRPTGRRIAPRTLVLAALDNGNQRYRLSALGPGDGKTPFARLCLDGRARAAGSWG